MQAVRPPFGSAQTGQATIFSQEILCPDETPREKAEQPALRTEGRSVSNRNGYFPNRVRELRENRLMTQAQLARKAKVALRTIHSVEKGMNCRMDTKRKILLALGLRFEDKDQVFPPATRASEDLLSLLTR
jgi:DNA-binding XRE family transcriptional regulator